MLQFEVKLAFRHLRSGGGQTVLTVSAVAAGVIVVVFISSLIFGLQRRITQLLTDIIPHVVVSPLEENPVPLRDIPGGSRLPTSTRIESQSQQKREITNWREAEGVIARIPGVAAIAPAVMGQGFVSRGEQRIGAQVFGAVPEQLDAVNPVTKYLVAGHYEGLTSEEIVISYKLAQDLAVATGDRVRLTSSEGLSESFLIAGIYDTGQERSVGSRAFLTLRAAQSLYATGTAVETILVRGTDLFTADRIAARVEALLPLDAEAWTEQSPQVVASLGAQSASGYLVSGFSLIASSFAIASILIVSVLQKSREIGILKSMGAKRRQILAVFLLEGLGIGIVGSLLGALVGSGIVWFLTLFKQPVTRAGAPAEQLFPAQFSPGVIVAAVVAAILATVIAALLPARRAARLNPVEVMR